MFSLGVLLLNMGYAFIYTGVANLMNGGTGPTLSESMGLPRRLAPPGADKPNIMGQPPQSAPSSPSTPNPAPRGNPS